MKTLLSLFLSVLITGHVFGQELKFSHLTNTSLDKEASKKGRYAGTYLQGNKAIVHYFMASKKEGLQMFTYAFDNALKFDGFTDLFVTKEQAEKEYNWYIPKEKMDKAASGNERFLLATRTFGSGMKISFGHIQKNYMQGIFVDWDFEEEGKLKPKTDGIWRIIPSGYKTTSDYTKLSTAYGFHQDLKKSGFPLLAPSNARLIAAGIIQEKVSIKNPAPTLGNRVGVLAIENETFDDSKFEIYYLPYSGLVMASGLGQEDNLSVLYAPLNAPSTLKSHRKYLWKNKKNHFTLMRFNDALGLVDSVSFQSELMWGKFSIHNAKGSSIISGMGKVDFDGWARNADMIGLKKMNGIQLTKIKDGQLIFSNLWHEDDLEAKLVVPEGEKEKYEMHIHHTGIKEVIHLPNGDDFLLGQSPMETYALQISSAGELKAFYRIGRIDEKKSKQYNYQMMIKGDDVYLVINEQPFEFSNETQVSESTSTFVGAYVTTSVSTTTVKRLNEVFVQSQLVRINTANQSMSNTLIIDGKEFYSMGSYPALFTEDAIIFTGREKGPKGKVIHIGRIDI